MTTERKIIIGLALALVIGGSTLGVMALKQHYELHEADSAAASNARVIEQLEMQRTERDKLDRDQQASARTQMAQVKTSADAVRVITRYLPTPADGAKPQVAVVSREELPAAEQEKLPESPSYTIQTQEAATNIAKSLISCEADRQSLTVCKADLKDADVQRAAEHDTAQHWEAVAKGGTKSQRLFRALKCVGIAGGGAAAGAATKDWKWAAVGAGVGAAVCRF